MKIDKLVLSVYFKKFYSLKEEKLELISADRNYKNLYHYKGSDYVVIKEGKRDHQPNNPDMMIYVNQRGCRDLDNPFNVLNEIKIVHEGTVYKETVSRIDIAVDVNFKLDRVLKDIKLKGRFNGASIHEDGDEQRTGKTWGKADNIQICIYDKKRDLIDNYPFDAWAFDQIAKLGDKPLTRLEIRIGKRYFKQLHFKNDKNQVFKNLSQIVNNIFFKQIETNKIKFNQAIIQKLNIIEKADKIQNREKYLEKVIKDHQTRLMRAFCSLQVIKKKRVLRGIFCRILRILRNTINFLISKRGLKK